MPVLPEQLPKSPGYLWHKIFYRNRNTSDMLTYDTSFGSYSVDRIPEAKDFYQKTLGLEVKETPEGLSIQVGKDYSFFLYPKPNHTPASYTVLNFIVEDIEAMVDQLVLDGVKFLHYEGELQTDQKGIFR